MKLFNNRIILILLLFVFIKFCICTKTRTRSKLRIKAKMKNKIKNQANFKLNHKFKKIETMPDFLAALDQANTQSRNPDEKLNKQIILVNRNVTNHTSRKKIYSNPDILIENNNTLDLIKEGWLKISSPSFISGKLYPGIRLPNYEKNEIPTAKNFFRINRAYDPFDENENNPPGAYYFYARLSRSNFYYSVTKNSIEVEGSVQIKDIREAISIPTFARNDECFIIDDLKAQELTFCAETLSKRNQWLCKIRELLKKDDFNSCIKKTNAETDIGIETVQKITQPTILIPLASPECNQDFNYDQNGSDWECDCREGNINK